ncbi:MAG: zinc ribbon domain-containing protein [Acidobacteriota bacterium]|nr:zinc ribbon domain-containing protein [Acidobacteriota bacterium]
MPLYEYRCQKCGTHFEKIRRFSDPPLKKCENCGGKLEQLLSSPAIQFKGSGFYINDYARKPGPDGSKPSPAASAEPSGNGKDAGTNKTAETPKSAEKPKAPATK